MLAVDGTKVCSNPECLAGGEPQAIENFNRDGSKTDGLSNWCRICRNRSHKGTIEKSFFIRGHEIKNRQKYNWWHLFHLRPEDVVSMYEKQDGRCLIGGEPLVWEDKYIHHDHSYPGCKQHKTRPWQNYDCPPSSVWGLVCLRHNSLEGWRAQDPEGYDAVTRWHENNSGGKIHAA